MRSIFIDSIEMQLQAQPGDLVDVGINAPVVLDDMCFDLQSFQTAWLVDDLLACERVTCWQVIS